MCRTWGLNSGPSGHASDRATAPGPKQGSNLQWRGTKQSKAPTQSGDGPKQGPNPQWRGTKARLQPTVERDQSKVPTPSGEGSKQGPNPQRRGTKARLQPAVERDQSKAPFHSGEGPLHCGLEPCFHPSPLAFIPLHCAPSHFCWRQF